MWLDNYGASKPLCWALRCLPASGVLAGRCKGASTHPSRGKNMDICILRKHLEMRKQYTESQSLNLMRYVVIKPCSTQSAKARKCLSQAFPFPRPLLSNAFGAAGDGKPASVCVRL